jgi:uncharacterized protein YdhG (YjbR/CyaY superfamily)
VAADSVDEYLDGLDEPSRSTLTVLRRTLLELVPDAEECIAYGVPAIRYHGTLVAGYAAARHHLSYLPHSGSVLASLAEQTKGYSRSKGALRFPVDTPLPHSLVEALVAERLAEIAQRPGR